MKKSHSFIIGLVCFMIVLPLMTLDTWMTPDIRLDTGDTAGANISFNPQIACSGSQVYAVWQDHRNGDTDIFYNYSSDNGVSWQSSASRLDTGDTAGANVSEGVRIACSGSNVYVVWQDYRNGSTDIFFNFSPNNGISWLPSAVRLDSGDTDGANSSFQPQIACTGSDVYVVWYDDRNGSGDIYFNFSPNNGLSWLPSAVRLDTGDSAGANSSVEPQITCSGNHVYALWRDDRNGSSDIYFNYSTDNGINWQTSDIRLDTGDTAGASSSMAPQIACASNHVYVVWQDSRNGPDDIYLNYSTDNGVSWQVSDIRLNTGDTAGANYSLYPQIACSGSNVCAIWQDNRNGGRDIYLNHSGDNGSSWQATDIRLDTGDTPGANNSWFPQISCYGNSVYAVWYDTRNGKDDIYLNFSSNSGVNWHSSPIRLDTGDTAGANYSYNPRIACNDSDVYAVWYDERNGLADIYFNRAVTSIDIKANGSDGPVSITDSDTLQIKVTLASNGLSTEVDYWLAYKGPSGWVHYNNSTKQWESGLGVTHQGPLMDLNNKKVFQKSGLAPGNYTFYFGVDMVMDGKVTKSSLYKDEVQVTVTSN